MSQRAKHLKEILEKLHEKLAFLEKEKVIQADPSREFHLRNKIDEVRAEIAQYKTELAQIMGMGASPVPPVANPIQTPQPDPIPPATNPPSSDGLPKVFISYSHDSKTHADRVLELSNRLRCDFVDARIDQYEVAPKEGWPRWMVKQFRECDFIIMVCTETYCRRCDGEEAIGKGQGVKWEGNLAYNVLYSDDSLNCKAIPVLFQDGSPKDVPLPFQGFTRHRLGSEDGYQGLLRHLRGQPSAVKPPMGKPPIGARAVTQVLPERMRQTSFDMSINLLDALNGATPEQLKGVISAVNMPVSEQLGVDAPHGDQVLSLLEWAESGDGCGLKRICEVLDRP